MQQIISEGRDRALLQKWGPMLNAGEKIESQSAKLALAKVFENTYREFKSHGLLTEAVGDIPGAYAQATPLGGARLTGKQSNGVLTGPLGREIKSGSGLSRDNQDFYMPNIIMPMLRRIFPTLIANELVGVQPLNGPLGYALAYRAKYGKVQDRYNNSSYEDYADKEIGFDPVRTGFTGNQISNDLSADFGFGADPYGVLTGDPSYSNKQTQNSLSTSGVGEFWEAYTGNNQTAWGGTAAATDEMEFAAFSQGEYPMVGFDLIKTAVEAKTRKLGAAWSPELAEDMENMHGMDVEAEMINIISYEMGAEIDRQIITEMVKAAITGGSVSTWSPAVADGLDQMGRLATLLTQITIEANQIALKTRRGNANFVVTSPRVCALLEQMSLNKFVSIANTKAIPGVPDSGVGAITKTGLINDGQQLLVRDSYAPGEYVLMGYKGSHPADSGIVYCPYIPVQLSKVLNPDTLTPQVGARTRYGVMSSPWDAKNYYHFIKIGGLHQTYSGVTGTRMFIQPYSKVGNGTLFV